MLTLVAMTLALAARGYAPVNGLQLYYEIHGNPAKNGVPLVLLHGAGGASERETDEAEHRKGAHDHASSPAGFQYR